MGYLLYLAGKGIERLDSSRLVGGRSPQSAEKRKKDYLVKRPDAGWTDTKKTELRDRELDGIDSQRKERVRATRPGDSKTLKQEIREGIFV